MIENVLVKILIAAYTKIMPFEVAVECFLFLEMPLKKAEIHEIKLQAMEIGRAILVGM